MKAVPVLAVVIALVVGLGLGYAVAWRNLDRYAIVATRAGALRMDRTNGHVDAVLPSGRIVEHMPSDGKSGADPYWVAP